MPTYPVKNLKTGETQTLSMTMSNYEKWREENPDWDKDWSQGCAGVGEVGEWQDHEDKSYLYQIPYKNMVKYMFEMPSEADFEMLYGNLKAQETIGFWSTSFIRGTTLDRAIIIVDEFQNLNFHELDSIITRIGTDSKIMFCGDATQTDLIKQNERNGIHDFMNILRIMPSVDIIEFGVEDIVRSGLCKEYLLSKLELNL
jgi:hypothetical protein